MKFTGILLLFLLTSCATYNINVRKDGSASVKIVLMFNDDSEDSEPLVDKIQFRKEITAVYSSAQISNFKYDTLSNQEGKETISFDILHIDSLGNYLDPIFGTYCKFQLLENKLEMTGPAGDLDSEEDVTGFTNLLDFKMRLNFERPVKRIETDNDFIKQASPNFVEIESNLGQLNYGGVLTKVVVYFDK